MSKVFDEHRKELSERIKNHKYMDLLEGCTIFIFQDFESYLRTEIDLVGKHFRLVFDDYNSNFFTCEIPPCICSFEDFPAVKLEPSFRI